jgi:hypothetical protein
MTKVKVQPGPCGFTAVITADTTEDENVKVTVTTGCPSVTKMMKALGDTFDPMEVCLCKPGTDLFHAYASENFPVHAACPSIISILKCIEAEAGLALKANVSIEFI